MKKFQLKYALWLLVFVVPAFMIACNDDDVDIKLDFELTVPQDWEYLVIANEGFIYSAARTPVDDQDSIREGLMIVKQKLDNWTLDQYFTAIRSNIVTSEFHNETLHVADTVVNGTDMVKMLSQEYMSYVNTLQDTSQVDIIVERYFFYENSYGYNMTFTCVDTLYDEKKGVFQQIMSTFNFLE